MAYRERDTRKWSAQWSEVDFHGERRRRKKRGFATKREAQDFELQKKLRWAGDPQMKMSEFIEAYFVDKQTELKPRSIRNRRYMIAKLICPYFCDMRMNDITPEQILRWQAQMIGLGYSKTYLRMMQNQLNALFMHAVRVYNLHENPCKRVRRMGKADAGRPDFWTLEEYQKFIAKIPAGTMHHMLFELLYWTGCRVGEALALTPVDIDLKGSRISITKTFCRIGGKDVLSTPKTETSVRTIEIPVFLRDELKDYLIRLGEITNNTRIFPIVPETAQQKIRRTAALAGIRRIRVHDLRHSHVAYLISRGVDPYLIKDRLGHKDIRITLNTYGHLYPSKQREIADLLDADYGQM